MTIADRIYEKLKSARPEVAQEVLDFLEFIQQRRNPAVQQNAPQTSWEASFGSLKDLGALEGDPVEVQRKLRDEWT